MIDVHERMSVFTNRYVMPDVHKRVIIALIVHDKSYPNAVHNRMWVIATQKGKCHNRDQQQSTSPV